MKLVVDSNILFSFFKKDSIVKDIILDPELKYGLELFSPELMLTEVSKHKEEICSKFGISVKDFEIMFASLELFIKIIKSGFFENTLKEAELLLKEHKKDAPYIALCLSLKDKNIAFWSNEKRLKFIEKSGVKVFSIDELAKELGLL